MNTKMKYLPILLWGATLVFSTACGSVETTPYLPPTQFFTQPAAEVTSTPVTRFPVKVKPKPAPLLQEKNRQETNTTDPQPEGSLPDPPQQSADNNPTPEALQFEAAAPDTDRVAAWRPPLYPVPLALTPFDHFYFAKPFSANENPWPVEDYRYGGSYFEDIVHTGMDIKIPVGTPVIASGPGKVVWAGFGLLSGKYDPEDPYGIAVMIRHDFGYKGQRLYTVYAHLDQVEVEQDQYVETGDFLGLSGKTGKTSGPHLHFEVRLDLNGFFTTRNPELWLVPPQGYGVLAGLVMNTGGRTVKGQRVIVRPVGSEQFWRANSYHYGYIYPDDYYQENLVVSDLPAGKYEISINYLSRIYRREIDIYPGLVTYFSFRGRSGFTSEAPPLPGGDFDPPQTP
jgi:murein DD-endopeptidase MepM/ murein hydrolase activator NlpD